MHKAGYVCLIGKPNVGKSTLMNALVGEKMSIITPKAQTTRHSILGIVNDEHTQIVFSDTPGIIKPAYGLHNSMMSMVNSSLIDADVIVWVTDINEKQDESDVFEKLKNAEAPVLLIINKVDASNEDLVDEKMKYWQIEMPGATIIPASALKDFNVQSIFQKIVDLLPEHPPYFDKDELTDRTERFFVSEIIREKIFFYYTKEIPYSTEVIVTFFKDQGKIVHIQAEIIVERESQKGIMIGTAGAMLKKVGTKARADIEEFLSKKVFLEMFVKVIPDWRNKSRYLKSFGYEH